MYFIQDKDIKMKITRRQIRRIIKEAVEASDQDKEAAFAIIYTSDYIQGYMGRAYNAFYQYRDFFNKTQEQRKQVSEYQGRFLKFIDALEKLTNAIMDPVFTLDVELDGLDTPERDSIEREGSDTAALDFGESVYKGIEEINKLVNEQTPIGMSVNAALAHLPTEMLNDSGFNANHFNQKVQVILDMMNDDEILEVMDELEDFIR